MLNRVGESLKTFPTNKILGTTYLAWTRFSVQYINIV